MEGCHDLFSRSLLLHGRVVGRVSVSCFPWRFPNFPGSRSPEGYFFDSGAPTTLVVCPG